MFVRNIAGLCKGSTADSDSVCEGSNPSPAAKKTLSLCWEFFLLPWFSHRDSDPHTNSIRAQLPALAPGVRILLPLPKDSQQKLRVFSFFRDSCHRDSRAAEGSGSYSENMRTCPPSGASKAAYRPCSSRAAKTGRSPAAAAPCMPAGRNCPARTSG